MASKTLRGVHNLLEITRKGRRLNAGVEGLLGKKGEDSRKKDAFREEKGGREREGFTGMCSAGG